MSAFLQKQINKALLDTEQTLPQNVQTYDKMHSVSFSPTIQRSQRLPTPVRQTQMPRSEIFSCTQNEDSSLATKSPQIELGDEFLKFMAQQDEEHLEQLLYTLGCSPIKPSTASLKTPRLSSACPCHSASTDCQKCLLSESPTFSSSGRSRHSRHVRNLGTPGSATQKKSEKSRSGRPKHSECGTHPRSSSKYSKYRAFSRSLKFDTQNLETLSAVASIQGDLDSSMMESLLQPPLKPPSKRDVSNKPKSKRKSYTLPRKSNHQSEVKPDTRCVHVLPQTSGSDSESNSCESLTTESKFGVLKKQVMPDGSNIEHLFLVPTDWLSDKVEVKMVSSEYTTQSEEGMPDQNMSGETDVYGIQNLQTNDNFEQVIQTSCNEQLLEPGQVVLESNKTMGNFEVLDSEIATNESEITRSKPAENDINSDVQNAALLQNDTMTSGPDVDPNVICKEQVIAQNDSVDIQKELKPKDVENSDQVSEYDGVLVSGNEPCVILMTKNLDCIDETVLTTKPMHDGQLVNDLISVPNSEGYLHVQKSQGLSLTTEEITANKGSISYASDIAVSYANLSISGNTETKMGKALTAKEQSRVDILETGRNLHFGEAMTSPSRGQSRATHSINISGCKTGVPYNSFTTRIVSNYSDISSASNSCSASTSYTSCESDFCSHPQEKGDVSRIINLVNMKHSGDTGSLTTTKRSNKVTLSSDHAIKDCEQRWKKWKLVVGDENVAQKTVSSNASCECHSHSCELSRAHGQNMQCLYHRLHPEFLLKELEKLVASTNSKLELNVLLQKLLELHEIINLKSSSNGQMVINDSPISCESEKELFYGIMMAAASVISFVKAYQVTVRNEGKLNQNCLGLISFFDKIIRHGVILITKMLFGYNHLLFTHQEKSGNMNSPLAPASQRDNTSGILSSMPCGHEEMSHGSNPASVAKFQKVIAYIRELQRAQNNSSMRSEHTAEELTNTEMTPGSQSYRESIRSIPDRSEKSFHNNKSYCSQVQTDLDGSLKCSEYGKVPQIENMNEVKPNECEEEEKVIGIVSDVALNVEVGNATGSSPVGYQTDDAHIPLLKANLKDQNQSSPASKQKSNKTKPRKPRSSKKLKPTAKEGKSSTCESSQNGTPCPDESQGKRKKNSKVSKSNVQGKVTSSKSKKSNPDSNERKRPHPEESVGDCDESSSSIKKPVNQSGNICMNVLDL